MISILLPRNTTGIISNQDADLALFRWHLSKEGNYVVRTIYVNRKPMTERIHRTILSRILQRPLTSKEQVDHIDGNRLNNIRENLRLASNSQNGKNRRISKLNKSGYKGVYKVRDKWRVAIKVNYKLIHLGYFNTPEEAHKAYCEAAIKYHGEFARFK